MAKLGEYLTDLNLKKEHILRSREDEIKGYTPYIINRSLSYFQENIYLVNEINAKPNLEKLLQYDFYIHSIRPKKRFARWAKPEKNDTINIIKEYYQYSNEKAQQVLDIITDDQIEYMKYRLRKGGKHG